METEIKLTKLANCAGCGAKVGAGTLAKLLGDIAPESDPNLLVGFDHADDASVYRVSDELALVQTLDFFPPIADDPYTYGRIAAANALSDVYAMGGTPKLAQNILAIPEYMPGEVVKAILRGGFDAAKEAGALVTGGHSIFDEEPKYGMCVTGFVHPGRVLTNSGAKVGDILFLTKPLGCGVITTAAKAGRCPEESLKAAIAGMTRLNKYAAEATAPFRAHACTDVTGFGLMGHALEMAQGSGATIEFYASVLPLLPGALALAREGLLPGGMYRNRAFAEAFVEAQGLETALADLLFDPQTSGGLLVAMDPADADAYELALKEKAPLARRVGRVREASAGRIVVLP
ncbi:MAG TPA: selenide, water dikinase SelD [Clostridia bacterium]|nr:selenide, water dikinase SelD [Clostridia bacterium]